MDVEVDSVSAIMNEMTDDIVAHSKLALDILETDLASHEETRGGDDDEKMTSELERSSQVSMLRRTFFVLDFSSI